MHRVARHQLHALQVARAQVQVLSRSHRCLHHQQRRALGVQLVQRLRGTSWSWLPSARSCPPPPACRPAASPPAPSAARPAPSCAGRRSRRSGASVRAPCRHAATVGSGSTPIRARPVPFCFHSFLPAPLTRPRVLGGVGPGPLRGAVVLHRFPQQVFVDCAEHLIGQLQRAHFLAAQIHYINRRHNLSSVQLATLPLASLCRVTSSSPLAASKPSTDRPCPSRQIHGALSAASSPW